MTFQIHSLPKEAFSHLFTLADDALYARHARREIVATCPGTPCRVSLQDARIGERVILVNYTHQPAENPYKSCHAIYIRENADAAHPAPAEVPKVLASRLISVRMFDAAHMMIDAEVVEGVDLAQFLPARLTDDRVGYIHLHYAKPGCYAALVTRPSFNPQRP